MPVTITKQWRDNSKKDAKGFRWNKSRKEAYFDIKDADGQRHRVLKSFPSIEDAR